MIIRVCCLTENGRELIAKSLGGSDFLVDYRQDEKLEEWVGESFRLHLPIIFVGACGIAVRFIAPYVKDKLVDSPVIVIDENGKYVIPILSGHMGGANELARSIADMMSGEAVITTATDVRGIFSVDVFAKKNGFSIVNREGIKDVSAKLLRGENIDVAIAPEIELRSDRFPRQVRLADFDTRSVDVRILLAADDAYEKDGITLAAKDLIVGMGCKKNKPFGSLDAYMISQLGADIDRVFGMASIDLKKYEAGLNILASYHHLPLWFYTPEELAKVEGEFTESNFVEKTTRVSNVCERAAMLAAGEGAKLIRRKQADDGMTIAIAKRVVAINTWDTN